ncbi:MAG: hypothetical protein EXS42_01625 [Lacunisphaera sp.]|nr:hypothetical protein [Lacunisphaera sp.]
MNLEPAPRLSKTIFLLIDAGLLLAAFIIAYFAKNPYAPLPFITAVLFVGAAGVVGLVPFLIDYAADSTEYVLQERERVNEQVQRLHTAGESLVRAAAQIKAVEEAVHKTAHAAENLPYRMQEKLAEFNAALAEKEENDHEALEQELAELRAANSDKLKAIAEKITSATTEWTALEAATRKQLAAAQDIAAKLEGKLKGAARLEASPAPVTLGGVPSSFVAASAISEPRVDPDPTPVAESVSIVESPASVVEESKPKKPRAPRKLKPEDTLAAMSESSASTAEGSDSEPVSPEAPGEASPAESSISIDGATRLLVTAYIGIGNKLFIRGDGPGLSPGKGVPMHFVSIGKWGWSTDNATGPVACKLYKNDETAALSGEIFVEPGQHVEVTALF